jgi:hypothetical protein
MAPSGLKPNGVPDQGNPIKGPKTKTLAPGQVITKTAPFRVPLRIAPSGPYALVGSAGSFLDATEQSSFEFAVVE